MEDDLKEEIVYLMSEVINSHNEYPPGFRERVRGLLLVLSGEECLYVLYRKDSELQSQYWDGRGWCYVPFNGGLPSYTLAKAKEYSKFLGCNYRESFRKRGIRNDR